MNTQIVSVEQLPASQTLRDIVSVFFYKKKTFMMVLLGVLVGTALVAFLSPPKYQVSADLLVKPSLTKPFMVDPTQGAFYANEVTLKDLNTIIFLLQSGENLERAIGRLKSTGKDDSKSLQARVNDLRARLKAEPLTESNVVRVTMSGQEARETTETLRTLIDAFNDYYIEVNRVPGGLEFFENQTMLLNQRHAQLNREIKDSSSKTGIVDPVLQKQNLLAEGRDLEQERARRIGEQEVLRAKIAAFEAALKRLDSKQESNLIGLPKSAEFEYVALVEMEKSLAQLMINVQRAHNDYQPDSKPYKDAEAQYANMHRQTHDYMKQIISDLRLQDSSLRQGMSNLDQHIASITEQVVRLANNALGYEQLQLERGIVEKHYSLYADKKEEARIRDAKDLARFANVSVAAAPQLPQSPVFPRPGLMMAIALVLGPILAMGASASLYAVEQRLRTPTDVSLLTRVKLLGSFDELEGNPATTFASGNPDQNMKRTGAYHGFT